MRDRPIILKPSPINKGKFKATANLFVEDGFFKPFYSVFPYNVNGTITFATIENGLNFYSTNNYSLVEGTQSQLISVRGRDARCAISGLYAYVYNGTISCEKTDTGEWREIYSHPGLACMYNGATPVLASFQGGKNAFWIGTPVGVEVGSLWKLTLDQLSGADSAPGDMGSLFRDFTVTFGISPDGLPITSVGQVADGICFFTRGGAHLARFSDSGLLVFSDPISVLSVGSHVQTFFLDGVAFVLSDDRSLYVFTGNKTEKLFDFGKIDDDYQKPSSIVGVINDTVVTDTHVVTLSGECYGPMFPPPVGITRIGGSKEIVVGNAPFDNEGYTYFFAHSDWLLNLSQGMATSTSFSLSSIATKGATVALKYVTDSSMRRRAVGTSRLIQIKPDYPAIVRRRGMNFSFDAGGMIHKDGVIGNVVLRLQNDDYRCVRGLLAEYSEEER